MVLESRAVLAVLFDVQGTATDFFTTVRSAAAQLLEGRYPQHDWSAFVNELFYECGAVRGHGRRGALRRHRRCYPAHQCGASTSLNGKGYAMGVNNTRTSFAQLAMAP
jgi:hypothetical protein